jgi:hypothetical protein
MIGLHHMNHRGHKHSDHNREQSRLKNYVSKDFCCS